MVSLLIEVERSKDGVDVPIAQQPSDSPKPRSYIELASSFRGLKIYSSRRDNSFTTLLLSKYPGGYSNSSSTSSFQRAIRAVMSAASSSEDERAQVQVNVTRFPRNYSRTLINHKILP
jgi:hypothetical protein